VLEKDGNGMRHMGSLRKCGTEVKGHDIKCREETETGKGMKPATLHSLSGSRRKALVEQCLRGHMANSVQRTDDTDRNASHEPM
jgi:hypothetical protein